jgi:hypothetical protein
MGREERLAQNEAMFREVNERIKDVSERTGLLDSGPDFICECADERCIERIRLSLGEYAALRADPRRFVVLRGHASDVERVVADRGAYLIVEKRGEAGEVAEREAPR